MGEVTYRLSKSCIELSSSARCLLLIVFLSFGPHMVLLYVQQCFLDNFLSFQKCIGLHLKIAVSMVPSSTEVYMSQPGLNVYMLIPMFMTVGFCVISKYFKDLWQNMGILVS